MDRRSFFTKLADILQANPAEVNDEYPLTSVNWDSVAVLGVIALIDQEFGVTVPTNELTVCTSAGMVYTLVQSAIQ